MTEEKNPNQNEQDLEIEQIENELKFGQLEKLRLENEGLKKKNVWDNRLGKWIPVITALIAVAGFLWGVYVYNAQQAKAEKDRIDAADQRAKDAEKAALDREQREKEAQEALNQKKSEEDKRLALDQQNETNRLAAEQKNLTAKIAADQQALARTQAFEQKKSLDILRQEISMANKAREFEIQKPYRETQMKLYFDAADAASTIATSRNQSERLKAEQKFWQLYWGSLSVVEDALTESAEESSVEKAMFLFGKCSSLPTSRFEWGSSDLTSTTFNLCAREVLNDKSLCLAYAIRDAVHKTWSVESLPATKEFLEGCKLDPAMTKGDD